MSVPRSAASSSSSPSHGRPLVCPSSEPRWRLWWCLHRQNCSRRRSSRRMKWRPPLSGGPGFASGTVAWALITSRSLASLPSLNSAVVCAHLVGSGGLAGLARTSLKRAWHTTAAAIGRVFHHCSWTPPALGGHLARAVSAVERPLGGGRGLACTVFRCLRKCLMGALLARAALWRSP